MLSSVIGNLFIFIAGKLDHSKLEQVKILCSYFSTNSSYETIT